MFGFNKKKEEKVITNLTKGLIKKSDDPTGNAGFNVKSAVVKSDSPFRKGDYKNPFMKED